MCLKICLEMKQVEVTDSDTELIRTNGLPESSTNYKSHRYRFARVLLTMW